MGLISEVFVKTLPNIKENANMDIDLSSTQRLLSYFPGLTSLMNLAEKEPSTKKWPQGHLWVISKEMRTLVGQFTLP